MNRTRDAYDRARILNQMDPDADRVARCQFRKGWHAAFASTVKAIRCSPQPRRAFLCRRAAHVFGVSALALANLTGAERNEV